MSEQAEHHHEVDHDAFEAKQHQGIRDWVSKQLGGEVHAIERLERWRPQWKVSFTKDGESAAVFVRGNRPIAGENDLRFEMEVMQVLEANGILVPHIYGWMDSPKAFVMDWVDTDDRAPGMLHTAIENPTSMDDDRWAAMLSYMDHLAKVHEVPVGEFAEIRGLRQLGGAEEIALRQTERMYLTGSSSGSCAPATPSTAWSGCWTFRRNKAATPADWSSSTWRPSTPTSGTNWWPAW